MPQPQIIELSQLIDVSEPVTRVAQDCVFTEGPIWMPDGSLLFSDLGADRLMRWHPETGQSVVIEGNNKGNGMTLDRDGNLIVCEHRTSSVTRGSEVTARTPVATSWGGRELNSPNDVIVTSDGSIIFTDPTFGRTFELVGVIRPIEQDSRGVYRVRADTGELELLITDLVEPNGLCLSRDETILYVGDTARGHVRAFEIADDGQLSGEFVFAEGITENENADDGFVDGLKLDEQGNLYVTGPGGIWVYAEDGARIGVIEIPEPVANFNWGESDWRTLFITATTSVYRVRMNVAGNRLVYMR